MSSNFEVLQQATPERSQAAAGLFMTESEEFAELIKCLFQSPTAVAVVGGSIDTEVNVCHQIASALAASGKRVVVVPVDRLLWMNPLPIPSETAFMPGNAPNIWLWPVMAGQRMEFFKSPEPAPPGHWLEALRGNFDSVLLDCPPVTTLPGSTAVMAMADAALLVVEAGRTPKQKIQFDQRALQSNGIRIAGYVLVQRT